jgi:hypothetical protein
MFKSKAQQKFLFSEKPEIAEEFAEKTPKAAYSKLPAKKKKKKSSDSPETAVLRKMAAGGKY